MLVLWILILLLWEPDIFQSLGTGLEVPMYVVSVVKLLYVTIIIESIVIMYMCGSVPLYTVRFGNEVSWYSKVLSVVILNILFWVITNALYGYFFFHYEIIEVIFHSVLDMLVYIHISVVYILMYSYYKEKAIFYIMIYMLMSYFIPGALLNAGIDDIMVVFPNNVNMVMRYSTPNMIVFAVLELIFVTLIMMSYQRYGLRGKKWILR